MIATTITIRILSEEPIPETYDLETAIKRCDDDYVLDVLRWEKVLVSEEAMARLLVEAGSDPGFFQIGDTP